MEIFETYQTDANTEIRFGANSDSITVGCWDNDEHRYFTLRQWNKELPAALTLARAYYNQQVAEAAAIA